jgi:hypothetical protein
VHFAEPPAQWAPIVSVLARVRGALSALGGLAAEAVGPFGPAGEAEMESLFDLGVRVRFACGLRRGTATEGCLQVDADALGEFARFGFRAPVSYYVDWENIREVEADFPVVLASNYSSGFSLPLACFSPYYASGDGAPRLPGANEYCQLLVRTYREHPHYDDLFSPLCELAMLIRAGGWHAEWDVPAAIQVLVSSSGLVGHYRQVPALAVQWTTVAELADGTPEPLRSRFLDSVREACRWDRRVYCRECRWRYICGGLDVPGASADALLPMDTLCAYRRLFLEHFALLRAPSVVIRP